MPIGCSFCAGKRFPRHENRLIGALDAMMAFARRETRHHPNTHVALVNVRRGCSPRKAHHNFHGQRSCDFEFMVDIFVRSVLSHLERFRNKIHQSPREGIQFGSDLELMVCLLEALLVQFSSFLNHFWDILLKATPMNATSQYGDLAFLNHVFSSFVITDKILDTN